MNLAAFRKGTVGVAQARAASTGAYHTRQHGGASVSSLGSVAIGLQAIKRLICTHPYARHAGIVVSARPMVVQQRWGVQQVRVTATSLARCC